MERVRKRFVELAEHATEIAASKGTVDVRKPSMVLSLDGPMGYYTETVPNIDWTRLVRWRTSVFSLLALTFGETSPTYCQFEKVANEGRYEDAVAYFDNLHPVFLSAKDQYEGGYLFDVRNLVHAEVFSDELDQAEHFLDQGYETPAAVITGVVLETTLRKLCEQTDDVQPTEKLNRMNDDLVKASVYNKMRADQVRAWAKIRNDAAHGNPDEFSNKDVELMIQGVRDFVANQLS